MTFFDTIYTTHLFSTRTKKMSKVVAALLLGSAATAAATEYAFIEEGTCVTNNYIPITNLPDCKAADASSAKLDHSMGSNNIESISRNDFPTGCLYWPANPSPWVTFNDNNNQYTCGSSSGYGCVCIIPTRACKDTNACNYDGYAQNHDSSQCVYAHGDCQECSGNENEDGTGTVVDKDSDGDGVCDDNDKCLGHPDDEDEDGDGVPDGCDTCDGYDDTLCDNGLPWRDVDAVGAQFLELRRLQCE